MDNMLTIVVVLSNVKITKIMTMAIRTVAHDEDNSYGVVDANANSIYDNDDVKSLKAMHLG